MIVPEYLELFQGDGNIKVDVKFKDLDGSFSSLSMEPNEINKLINPETNEFYKEIRFDDWLFEVYRYSIDPIKRKLTIMVRKKPGCEYP